MASTSTSHEPNHRQQNDLVGGPFAVIESDPGVFSTLIRKLGVRGLELVEIYDIEPWAVDHLNPYGLIFCFLWNRESGETNQRKWSAEEEDPSAKNVWFANQLSDDACASQAILNVLLNCPGVDVGGVDVGEELRSFKEETLEMSSVMRGLAISNHSLIRDSQVSLARPADIRGAINAIASTTIKASKATKPKGAPPAKRQKVDNKTTATTSKAATRKTKSKSDVDSDEETYHFIGYVPAHGKVWELDGLKAGPLEVGELPSSPHSSTSTTTKGWMDVVRPALRLKMSKYAGEDNIRFNLLAIVDSAYESASDELELLKRERKALERRLGDEYGDQWWEQVDPTLRGTVPATPLRSNFSSHFGSRGLDKAMAILNTPKRDLVGAWEVCTKGILKANVGVEEEMEMGKRVHVEHIKRTHDYEPFIKEFVTCLHNGGFLNPLLGMDDDGKKVSPVKSSKVKGIS